MSEKKQYKVGFFDDPTDVDDYVECDGKYLTSSDVVVLLNEQEEEIKSLKLENKLLLEEMKEIRDKLTIYLEIKGDVDD